MQLGGIHHLTAISAKPRDNLAFYTGLLGMRLVKKTVNQDDVSAYHLFYADGKANPGTDLTFFDFPAAPEQRGTNSISRTGLRVAGEKALGYWRDRLKKAGVTARDIVEVDGRLTLPFEDGEGQRLVLVDDGGKGAASPWERSPVPAEHQIRGLGPIVLTVADLSRTAFVLTDIMNMRRVRDYAAHGAQIHVFEMGEARGERNPAAELHVIEDKDSPVARQGAGGVHHVAFRTPDEAQYHAWTKRLTRFARPQQRRDRPLLFPQPLFPRTQRHPVRDRHRRPGLCDRRADGNARRKTGAAAVPGAAKGGDRGGAEADFVSRRMGGAKRNPSSSYSVPDGYRCAPPILRATALQLKGRGRRQTPVHGLEMIELFDGTIKFFADRNLRQIILHLIDTGREVGNIELLN